MSRCVIRNTHVGTSTANEESKSLIGQFRAVPFRPQATLQNAYRILFFNPHQISKRSMEICQRALPFLRTMVALQRCSVSPPSWITSPRSSHTSSHSDWSRRSDSSICLMKLILMNKPQLLEVQYSFDNILHNLPPPRQVGHVKVLCIGLAGNVIRFIYISYIRNPWWAKIGRCSLRFTVRMWLTSTKYLLAIQCSETNLSLSRSITYSF